MFWHGFFIVAVGIWVLSDCYLVLFYHYQQNNTLEEKRSKYWMIFLITLGMLSGILLSQSAKIAWLRPFNEFRIFGVALLVIGINLRWIAVLQLGHYFHSNVGTLENHSLITSGLYAVIRHPSYTGLLFNFIGIAFVYAHPISSIVAFVFPLTGLLIRISIEEKILIMRFPDEYPKYRKKTKKLVPWIY